MEGSRGKRGWRLLSLSLALVLLGGGLAAFVQTNAGSVEIRDLRFNDSEGRVMSGLLYVPETATAETPAPAVLAVHGYLNSRETQSPFAIELARRGYVVLALDQTGHGYSDPPAFDAGFGGPAGLAHLRSLAIVDPDNIGMSGHSMGTWAATVAAAVYPDGYQSVVMQASAPGVLGTPEGSETFPRNTMVLFPEWEEFSELFWGTPIPREAYGSENMMQLFGTDQPVEPGVLHGSIEDGTARILEPVTTTHPGLHWSPTATALTVDWFAQTLEGGHEATAQTWWLKEIGTLIAMLGGILFVFAAGALLLRTPFFGRLRRPVPPARGIERGWMWWLGAAVATAVPAVTFFYFLSRGSEWLPASRVLPQEISNGVLVWAAVVAGAVVVLMGAWHLAINRHQDATLVHYGLRTQEGTTPAVAGRSALLALTLGAGVWGLLYVSDLLFKTDFRLWIYQMKLMDPLRLRIFLTYLVPLAVIFVIITALLHGQFRPRDHERSIARAMVANALILVTGITVLAIANYLPLLLGGSLWVDTQPLLSIVAGLQFIPILAVVAVMSTFFFRLTGTVYTGAFLAAMFLSWNLAAGQAIQYPSQVWGPGTMLVSIGLPVTLGIVLGVWSLVTRHDRLMIPGEATQDVEERPTLPA